MSYPEYQQFILNKADGLLPPTSADIEGPFYKADAKLAEQNKLCDYPTISISFPGKTSGVRIWGMRREQRLSTRRLDDD